MPRGARRAQYRRFGLCGQCGAPPWREKASLCVKHRKAANKREKRRRKLLGRPQWLKNQVATLQQQLREKRARNSQCRECGDPVEKYARCLKCRLLDQSYRKKKAA